MEEDLPFLLWTSKKEVDNLLRNLIVNKLTSQDIALCKNIKDTKTRELVEKLIAQNEVYSAFFKKLEHGKGD